MAADHQKRNTVLFVVLLLIAGTANLLARTDISAWDTLMACLNYIIYIGLLLFWIQTVFTRLLPSAPRTYMIAAGYFMLAYMLVRIFKYSIATKTILPQRYAVYGYWVPQMIVPALFLMICICVRRGEDGKRKVNEMLILLPAIALSVLVMTNDLHGLVYTPSVPLPSFIVDSGTYKWGSCFFILYAWMAACVFSGVFPLLRRMRKRSVKAILSLSAMIALWVALILLYLLVLEKNTRYRMFNIPEIHVFCMLGVFEICIRNRLFPYNENYTGFFSKLSVPVLITDRQFHPVYHTAFPVDAGEYLLKASLEGPVYLTEDIRLSGMPVRAGYAFWTEDEKELHSQQRKLASANELLGEENDLIAAENRLKEQKAHLDAQNLVYDRIAQTLYPKQKRIEALLSGVKPGTEEFHKALGLCCVLNAWSKRKSNLLLLTEETLPVRNRELFLALQESARFLKYCGISAAAVGEEYADFPLKDIHELYDTFEAVLEAWLPALRSMTVSLTDTGIRMALETKDCLPVPETVLPVTCQVSEGITFLTINRRTGGDGR
ncbi:MAG: hypothetical protein IKG08_00140 [Eubacterium sp.]|nr:hypothetical protein [Eubacterium sp.]MBR3275010.1 hypothetical protein [Eubacterium sp.]